MHVRSTTTPFSKQGSIDPVSLDSLAILADWPGYQSGTSSRTKPAEQIEHRRADGTLLPRCGSEFMASLLVESAADTDERRGVAAQAPRDPIMVGSRAEVFCRSNSLPWRVRLFVLTALGSRELSTTFQGHAKTRKMRRVQAPASLVTGTHQWDDYWLRNQDSVGARPKVRALRDSFRGWHLYVASRIPRRVST